MSDQIPTGCGEATTYELCPTDRLQGFVALAFAVVFLGPVSLIAAVALIAVQVARQRRPAWWVGVLAALGGLLGGLGSALQLACLFQGTDWVV